MKTTTAAAAALAVIGSVLLAPPATAGNDWQEPQRMAAKYGRDVNLSRDGRVAVWIRTNRIGGVPTSSRGRVLSAWYRTKKRKWSKPRIVPAEDHPTDTLSARTHDVQLSRNADSVLLVTPGGYLVSDRLRKNRWGAPEVVAEGVDLWAGVLSATGNTVAWWQDRTIRARTRLADGTWGPTLDVGRGSTVDAGEAQDTFSGLLSGDGTTIVWIDEDHDLVGSTYRDGVWTPPALIAEYTPTEASYLRTLRLSHDGERAIWRGWRPDGVYTATRTGDTWSPPEAITASLISSAALSPNGKVVAHARAGRDDLFLIQQWLGDERGWGDPVKLGEPFNPWIALTNTAVAWTPKESRSRLRASIRVKGEFRKPERLAKLAIGPAISFDGKTVAWSDPDRKRVMSIKR